MKNVHLFKLGLFVAFIGQAMTAYAQVAPNGLVFLVKQDTTIYENASLSNGAGDFLLVGKNGNAGGNRILRGLVSFDFTGPEVFELIPTNAIITDVELTLTVNTPESASTRAGDVTLHRITSDWGEGTSHAMDGNENKGEGNGAAPTANDATWTNSFFNTANWTSPGGDFLPAVSDRLDVDDDGVYMLTGTGLVNDVQYWLEHPSENYGWLLKRDDETQPAIRFGSRTNDEDLFPILVVDYRLPAPGLITHTLIDAGAGQIRLTVEEIAFDKSTDVQVKRDLMDPADWTTITTVSNIVDGGVISVDLAPLPHPFHLRLESSR